MAGVGRKSDFGKPGYSTNADEENRLDTTEPLIDWTLPYEERVQAMVDRGMTRKEAEEWISHAMEDLRSRSSELRDILMEETKFRIEIGDLKNCTPIDESCIIPEPGEEETKTEKVREKEGPLP
jgi:hypothetical protein